MENNKNQKETEYFDEDVLEHLRSSAQSYKKLNFAYAAAGGAIITALNLSESEFYAFTAGLWFIAAAFILLLIIDTEIVDFLLNDWIAAKQKSKNRRSKSTIMRILAAQRYMHLLFISLIIVGVVSFSYGHSNTTERFSYRANIQDILDAYILKEGHIPRSIDELKIFDEKTAHWISELNDEPIRIELKDDTRYIMTFSGKDREFDTDDDFIVMPEVKIRDLMKSNTHKSEQ